MQPNKISKMKLLQAISLSMCCFSDTVGSHAECAPVRSHSPSYRFYAAAAACSFATSAACSTYCAGEPLSVRRGIPIAFGVISTLAGAASSVFMLHACYEELESRNKSIAPVNAKKKSVYNYLRLTDSVLGFASIGALGFIFGTRYLPNQSFVIKGALTSLVVGSGYSTYILHPTVLIETPAEAAILSAAQMVVSASDLHSTSQTNANLATTIAQSAKTCQKLGALTNKQASTMIKEQEKMEATLHAILQHLETLQQGLKAAGSTPEYLAALNREQEKTIKLLQDNPTLLSLLREHVKQNPELTRIFNRLKAQRSQ